MRLPKAKDYALEMVKGIWAGQTLIDPLRHLHQISLKEEPRRTPLNLMGVCHQWHDPTPVNCTTVAEVLLNEIGADPAKPAPPVLPLPGDDYQQLDYDENGYPELPDCLGRR